MIEKIRRQYTKTSPETGGKSQLGSTMSAIPVTRSLTMETSLTWSNSGKWAG